MNEPSPASITAKSFKILLTVVVVVVGVTQTPLIGILGSASAGIVTSVGTYLQANPQSQSLNDALVGHWTFDGPDVNWSDTTSEIKDRSGQANHGNALNFGSEATVPGVLGQAISLNGIDESVSVPANSDTDLPAGADFTVSAWVKLDSLGGAEFLVTQGTVGVSFNYHISINAVGGINFYNAPQGSSGRISVNEWNHVLVTKSGTTISYYINGLSAGSSVSNNTGSLGQSFKIGSNGTSRFDGAIDDVRFYNRSISAEEVQSIYNSSRPTAIQPLVENTSSLSVGLEGYYSFDTANVNFGDTTSEIKDSSANNFDGDLVNHELTLDQGVLRQALDFDGTNDYVELGTSRFQYANDFTVATWVKIDFDTNDEHGLIHTWGGRWQMRVDTNGAQVKPYFFWHNSGGFTGLEGPDLEMGKWHHLAFVKQAAVGNAFYIDGILVDSDDNTLPVTYVGGPTRLGGLVYTGFDNRNYLGGTLDETRVYSRPLTPEEISLLANIANNPEIFVAETTSQGSLSSGLVGHWTFDGPDMDLSNASQEIKDRSGNGHNGNWVNHATTTTIGKIGQSIEFDGVDDYINSGYDPVITDSEWSISAWFLSDSDLLRNHTIIGAQSGSIGSEHRIFYDRSLDRLSTRLGDSDSGAGVGLHTTDSFFDGEWQHVMVTGRHLDRINLYVNGQLADTENISSNTQVTNSINPPVYQIGTFITNGSRQDYFDGKIDDVRIYERMLSEEEVKRLYDLGN